MSSTTISVGDRSTAEDQDLCRLVLVNSAGTDIFLLNRNEQWVLPEIPVPRFSRFLEEITDQARRTWGVMTTHVFSNYAAMDGPQKFFVVLEIPKSSDQVPGLSKWSIPEATLLLQSSEHIQAVEEARSRVLTSDQVETAGPFARLGWIYDLQEWIQKIPEAGVVRSYSQMSGSDDRCLARFDTSKKTLWYKAVGKSDPKEYAITSALWKWTPDYLPRILAFDEDRQGWLMESGGETALRQQADFEMWLAIVRRLADMQISSLSRAPELLSRGCIDARISTLLDLERPFFQCMDTLMQQQIKNPPPPLTRGELDEVAGVIRTALWELGALGIPDVIGHSDFNPGNILINRKITFIDWSAAHVGNPFLTLEYLIAHFRRIRAPLPGEDTLLRQTFLERWSTSFRAEILSKARIFTPLIAVFASAVADNSWRDPALLALPRVPGYLRSLARIMKREAQSLISRRHDA